MAQLLLLRSLMKKGSLARLIARPSVPQLSYLMQTCSFASAAENLNTTPNGNDGRYKGWNKNRRSSNFKSKAVNEGVERTKFAAKNSNNNHNKSGNHQQKNDKKKNDNNDGDEQAFKSNTFNYERKGRKTSPSFEKSYNYFNDSFYDRLIETGFVIAQNKNQEHLLNKFLLYSPNANINALKNLLNSIYYILERPEEFGNEKKIYTFARNEYLIRFIGKLININQMNKSIRVNNRMSLWMKKNPLISSYMFLGIDNNIDMKDYHLALKKGFYLQHVTNFSNDNFRVMPANTYAIHNDIEDNLNKIIFLFNFISGYYKKYESTLSKTKHHQYYNKDELLSIVDYFENGYNTPKEDYEDYQEKIQNKRNISPLNRANRPSRYYDNYYANGFTGLTEEEIDSLYHLDVRENAINSMVKSVDKHVAEKTPAFSLDVDDDDDDGNEKVEEEVSDIDEESIDLNDLDEDDDGRTVLENYREVLLHHDYSQESKNLTDEELERLALKMKKKEMKKRERHLEILSREKELEDDKLLWGDDDDDESDDEDDLSEEQTEEELDAEIFNEVHRTSPLGLRRRTASSYKPTQLKRSDDIDALLDESEESDHSALEYERDDIFENRNEPVYRPSKSSSKLRVKPYFDSHGNLHFSEDGLESINTEEEDENSIKFEMKERFHYVNPGPTIFPVSEELLTSYNEYENNEEERKEIKQEQDNKTQKEESVKVVSQEQEQAVPVDTERKQE